MMNVLVVFGTRPEAIKLAPLIKALQARPRDFDLKVCITAQHREMLDQVLRFFEIRPDVDLNVMTPDQTLFDITARCLSELQGVMRDLAPDNVIVQGDATSAFVGALSAFYARARVTHVEAGLRTGDRWAPYPEEVNRALVGRIADYHFAPTERARTALAAEGIRKNVWVVGNTVIDALLMGLKLIQRRGEGGYLGELPFLDAARRIILVTGHRRESFGAPFLKTMIGIKQVAQEFPDTDFVYPVHPNPNVTEPVERVLTGVANIHLLPPLDYPHLISLMNRAYLVVTDSGGIQEEAPSLGKPVLVTRDVTERVEGIEAGTAKLVGTDGRVLVSELRRLMTDPVAYRKMASAVNPYGNGTSSQQIAEILKSEA